MKVWAVIHDIYEEGNPIPVVRHIFMGQSQEEALGYYEAHRKTDAFLRSCDDRGRWGGIDCKTEGWVDQIDWNAQEA